MNDPLWSWGFHFRFLFPGHESGNGAFVWFPDDQLAVQFLYGNAPFLLPGDRASQLERHYAAVDAAQGWVSPHPGYEIGPNALARGMNDAFAGVMTVDWFGSFIHLCREETEFERGIRLGYFRSTGRAAGPIHSREEMLAFLGFCSQDGAKHW